MNTNSNTLPSSSLMPINAIDKVSMCINKAIAITDLMGCLSLDGGCDDETLQNAAWAAKDLLRESIKLIDGLSIVDMQTNAHEVNT